MIDIGRLKRSLDSYFFFVKIANHVQNMHKKVVTTATRWTDDISRKHHYWKQQSLKGLHNKRISWYLYSLNKKNHSYPFLFRLSERARPILDHQVRSDAYWGQKKILGKIRATQVCLVHSKKYRNQIIFFISIFSFSPTILYALFGNFTIFLIAPIVGYIPLLVWGLLSWLSPCCELLSKLWPSIPIPLRHWVRSMILTPENRSPIIWVNNSPDESLLRFALVDYFGTTGTGGVSKKGFWRIIFRIFTPFYLSFASLWLQAIFWSIYGPSPSNSNTCLTWSLNWNVLPTLTTLPPDPKILFGTLFFFWLILSWWFSEKQLAILRDQVYASGSRYKTIPSVIENIIVPIKRIDLSTKPIRYGLPGIYIAISTISIPFLQLIFD